MTKGPGASIYMTPEATAPPASNAEKSKYDTNIGIFSFGVVSLSTIGEIFCYDPLAPTYTDHKSGLLVARTELQRRSMYMGFVNSKLRDCGQLRADQPFIRLIQQCLQNLSTNRPVIHKIQCLLEEARGSLGDRENETDRHNIVQALQFQPRNQVGHSIFIELMCDNIQNLECVLRDLVTKNADLQFTNQTKDREIAEAQQQLREKVIFSK